MSRISAAVGLDRHRGEQAGRLRGFRVYAASGPWTKVATTAGTSYTDGSAIRRTTYWYVVRACNEAGNRSADSPQASITIR